MSMKVFPNDDSLVLYITTRKLDYNNTEYINKIPVVGSETLFISDSGTKTKINQKESLLADINPASNKAITLNDNSGVYATKNLFKTEDGFDCECTFSFAVNLSTFYQSGTDGKKYPIIGIANEDPVDSKYIAGLEFSSSSSLYGYANTLYVYDYDDNVSPRSVTLNEMSYNFNKTMFITLVYTKSEHILYVNGKEQIRDKRNFDGETVTTDISWIHKFGTLAIASNGSLNETGTLRQGSFSIGEIRIHKRALSDREIEKLYNLYNITPKTADTLTQENIYLNGMNGDGSHPSSGNFGYNNYVSSKTRVESFEKLSGFVSNYKFNRKLWFNQSSSFIYQTMNRIPLIEPAVNSLKNNRRLENTAMSIDNIYTNFVENHVYKYKNVVYDDTVITGSDTVDKTLLNSELLVYDQDLSSTRVYKNDIANHDNLIYREIQNNLGLSIPIKKKYYINDPVNGSIPGFLDRLQISFDINVDAELTTYNNNDSSSKIVTYYKLTQDYNSAYNPMFFAYEECSLNEKDPYSYYLCNTMNYQTYLRYVTGKPLPSSYTRYNTNVSNGIPLALKYSADQSNPNAGQINALTEFKNKWLVSLKMFNHPTHAYDADTFLLADTNRYVKVSGEAYGYSPEEYKEFNNSLNYKDNLYSFGIQPSYPGTLINPFTRFYNYRPIGKCQTFNDYKISYLLNSSLYPTDLFDTIFYRTPWYQGNSLTSAGDKVTDLLNNRNIPNDAVLIKTLLAGTNEEGTFSDSSSEYAFDTSNSRQADSIFTYSGIFVKIVDSTTGGKLSKDMPLQPITHIEGGRFKTYATSFIDMRSYLFHYDIISNRTSTDKTVVKQSLNHMTIDIGPSIDMREYAMNLDNYALSAFGSNYKYRTVIGNSFVNRNGSFNLINLHSGYTLDVLALTLSGRTFEPGTNTYSSPIGLPINSILSNKDAPITSYPNVGQNLYNTGIFSGTRFNNFDYLVDNNSKIESWILSTSGRNNYFGNAAYNMDNDADIIGKRLNYYYSRSGGNLPDTSTYTYNTTFLNMNYSIFSPFNTKMVFMPYNKQFLNGMDVNRSDKYYHIDFAGYLGQPIDEFNTPVNNGLAYRLGLNQSFRTGLGLTVLAEKSNLSKPSTLGYTDYLRTFTHNYSGWGNNQNHTAQRDRMMTTFAFSCNARDSKYSYFRPIKVSKSKKYKHSYNPIDITYDIKHNTTIKISEDSDLVIDLNLPSERFNGTSVFVCRTNHLGSGSYTDYNADNYIDGNNIEYVNSEQYHPMYYTNQFKIPIDMTSSNPSIPGMRGTDADNAYGSLYQTTYTDAVEGIGLKFTDRVDQVRSIFKYENKITTTNVMMDITNPNSLFANATFKNNQSTRSLFWNNRNLNGVLLSFGNVEMNGGLSTPPGYNCLPVERISIVNNGYSLPQVITSTTGVINYIAYTRNGYTDKEFKAGSSCFSETNFTAYFNTMDVTRDLLTNNSLFPGTNSTIFKDFINNTNGSTLSLTMVTNNLNDMVVVSGNSRNLLKVYNHMKYHNEYNGYIIQTDTAELHVSRKKTYKHKTKMTEFKNKIQNTVYKQYKTFFS